MTFTMLSNEKLATNTKTFRRVKIIERYYMQNVIKAFKSKKIQDIYILSLTLRAKRDKKKKEKNSERV